MDKLKAFWAKITSDIGTLWAKDKGFVILFGVVILGVQFRNILIGILSYSAKNIFKSAQKEDAALAQQEDANKTSAERYEEQANQTTNYETPVNEDWNKK
jgi:hypothetical protein